MFFLKIIKERVIKMKNNIEFTIKTKINFTEIAKNNYELDKAIIQFIDNNDTLCNKIEKQIKKLAISLFFNDPKKQKIVEEEKKKYKTWNEKAMKKVFHHHTYEPLANEIKYLYNFQIIDTTISKKKYITYNLTAKFEYQAYVNEQWPDKYRSCDYCDKIVHVDDYYEAEKDFLCTKCFENWLINNRIDAEKYFKNNL